MSVKEIVRVGLNVIGLMILAFVLIYIAIELRVAFIRWAVR